MKKYLTVLCDGMADYPDENGKTPMDEANKPVMDKLCENGVTGLVHTVPDGMKPGSDVCNLAVLGYDPKTCYTGRSPLEALSIGIELGENDVTYRMNLVTLSGDDLDTCSMLDYSAGEISTEEAGRIVESLKPVIPELELHAGVSYRHAAVMRGGKTGTEFTPPHDITDKPVKGHLPTGVYGELFRSIIKRSITALKDHPVNKARIAVGKNPVTAVWFWGEGTKPALENFRSRFGKRGAVISAVDLVKGIGKGSGMTVYDIPTATGTVNTDYAAKCKAAAEALETHDYVFVHLEGPDECGHQGDRAGKILSIERIDAFILAPLLQKLKSMGEYAISVMPDHATPLSTRTHARDPIPFMIYDSESDKKSGVRFSEKLAATTGLTLENGSDVIKMLFGLKGLSE